MRGYIFAACAAVVVLTAVAAAWFFQEAAGLAQPAPAVEAAPAAQEPPPNPYRPTEKADLAGGEALPRQWGPLDSPKAAPVAPDAQRNGGRQVYGPVEPRRSAPDAPFVADELLVTFRPGVAARDRARVNAAFGATEVAALARNSAFLLRLPAGSDVTGVAGEYQEHPLVDGAQPNYTYTAFVEPTDPAYTEIQHWYYHAINAPAGWDVLTGGPDPIVAVVDTGASLVHPDLAGQLWVNPGEIPGNNIDDDLNDCIDDVNGCNFVTSTPNGNPTDDIGHGTFVATVACGEANNGVSGAGTAFDCTIMPVKVLDAFGFGNSAGIAAGITYAAENGADIINLSLGFGCNLSGPPLTDPLVEAALTSAHDVSGVTIVASAGNGNVGCVGFPASHSTTIAVGASGFLDDVDGRSSFSQWGPEVDVAAPGVNIVSAVPASLCGFMGQCLPDGRTAIASGTSFSAPQVSGLAALLLAQDPGRGNEDIRTIIRDSARDLPDGTTPNWDGAGRLDVGAALGGGSVFADVAVAHNFPPELQLMVGVGDPSAPACPVTLLNAVPLISFGVRGSFGVGECAGSWPPTAGTPWFLRAVDGDAFPDSGQISAWSLDSGALLCTAFDTPVAIPDNDPAGGVSLVECPLEPELTVSLSAPAGVIVGDEMDYTLRVSNAGAAKASPVSAEVTLAAEVAFAGPAPAGCAASNGTVTCDFGSLASGESTTVDLAVDTNASGVVTSCATVDPGDDVAEVNETNNTDCAETELIEIPSPTFVNSDPPGDSFGFGPPDHDVVEVRGSFDASTFYLTVEFAAPVDPAGAGTGRELAGAIDFDTDQDPDTGFSATANFFCFSGPNSPPGMTGSDVIADLFSVSGGSLRLFDTDTFEPVGSAPILFGGNSFTAFIPLSALSGDDAFDFTMVLGSLFGPTDCAPNGTVISCGAGACEKAPPPPRPGNDDFADALAIPDPLTPPFSIKLDTTTATVEQSEARPCAGIDKTVWFSFTPSSDVVISADTVGSSFDTVLAAYTGEELGSLSLIECNDDTFGGIPEEPVGAAAGEFFGGQSEVRFGATAGETYYFQAGGFFGSSGNLVFNLASQPLPPCSPDGNPGFELGPLDTNVIPCWTVVDQDGGVGSWCNYTGTLAPGGPCSGSFASVLSPPAGMQAAMTGASGPGSHVLYRCGVLSSEEIRFQFYVNNLAGEFQSPLSLDLRRIPNQQFRADLVSAAGMAADPFTVDPADILLNLAQTQPFDPPSSGYSPVAALAKGLSGEEVCLRFAEVDTIFFMHVGVDDVQFITGDGPDTDGDTLPDSVDPDDDNDGCLDDRELGSDAAQGGGRDPLNFWDFFDTPNDANERDALVSAPDLARIVSRFGASGDKDVDPLSQPPPAPAYHPAFDRTPPGQAPNGRPQGPDGSIAAADIALVVGQFGHTCA